MSSAQKILSYKNMESNTRGWLSSINKYSKYNKWNAKGVFEKSDFHPDFLN